MVRSYTVEEKKSLVAKIDELRGEGLGFEEACAKAGIPYVNYYRWSKDPVDGRTNKGKKKPGRKPSETEHQVVVYKPEPSTPKQAVRTTKQSPQMTLVMGTAEQIAELLRSR